MNTKRISKNVSATRGNVIKYAAYREGFARIKAAIKARFPLEAIAIEEAIISDRISSHLGYHNSLPKGKHPSFGQLIEKLRKLPIKMNDSETIALAGELDTWREKRNTAIHCIVKSKPGTSPIDPKTFRKNAAEAAEDGKSLARKVCDWHVKEKKRK